jgi:hypothetical protein
MDPWRIVGAAKAGMFGHYQFVALGKCVEERQPLQHTARAVQEQHPRAAPAAVHFDGDASHLEFGELSWQVFRSFSKTPLSQCELPAGLVCRPP